MNELKDVSITHLRPVSFYSNMYAFIPMIKFTGIICSNYGGSDKVVMVHTNDIAITASEELQKLSTDKKVRYLTIPKIEINQ